ncbi:MAG: FG-GAP-like repeat-containing protein [bacterium]
MNVKKTLFSFLILMLYTQLNAQNWNKIDSVFAPQGIGVNTFSCPFVFDYDKDGYDDIFLGSTDNRVKFYRCKSGNTLPPTFSANANLLDQIYANGYQYTNSYYPVVVDIDNDFIDELIISGYNGLLLYKNIGDYNSPQWIEIDTVFNTVNTLIGTDAKPSFVDIDNDGDFDLFVGIGESLMGGPTAGITMTFRNIGSASNPNFEQDLTLVTNIPDAGYNSFPTFADLDNDGDFDLLIGRDLATFLYYVNTGSDKVPNWTQNGTVFSGVESTNYWKTPTLTDLDKDGDYDLLYGTDDGDLLYYENTGTALAPRYTYRSEYFKVIKNDGSGATVSTADFDNDGDVDFVSGSWTGKFNYYKNNGTKNEPIFVKSTAAFTNLSVSSYSYPVFVDLDNDNDFDLVSGALNGKLVCYMNNNGVFQANTTTFASISVPWFSLPAFGDLDGDGDQDLFLGAETSSDAAFYINNNGVFSVDNSLIRNVNIPNDARATFSDIDNDGDLDLIIGKSFGEILYYKNIGSKTQPQWELDTEIFDGIEVKQNASPGFADFDGDTKKDAIIAEYDGNFTFFKNLFAITGVEDNQAPIIPSNLQITNYPNPFNPSTTFQFNLIESSNVKITLFSSIGEKIAELTNEIYPAGINKLQFNSQVYNLSSGVYFYKFDVSGINNSNSKSLITGKIVLMK